MGRGREQGSRVETLRTQGLVYAITPQTKLVDQSTMHGMFLLSHLWEKIFFYSSVDVLGLEVETLEESFHVSSPLGTRVRIDKIFWDCQLEITVDL